MRSTMFVANFPAHPAILANLAKFGVLATLSGATIASERIGTRIAVDMVIDGTSPAYNEVVDVIDSLAALADNCGGKYVFVGSNL